MRDTTLDIAKGIGIILVLLGHIVRWDGWCSQAIFSFHMPLFFFVAGLVLKSAEGDNGGRFVKTQAVKLLVPYLYFCFIGWLLCRLCYPEELPAMSAREAFRNFFCHSANGPIWFLFALFWVKTISHFLLPFLSRGSFFMRVVILILIVIACRMFSGLRIDFPLALKSVPAGLLFYLVFCLRSDGNAFEANVNVSGSGSCAQFCWPVVLAS